MCVAGARDVPAGRSSHLADFFVPTHVRFKPKADLVAKTAFDPQRGLRALCPASVSANFPLIEPFEAAWEFEEARPLNINAGSTNGT